MELPNVCRGCKHSVAGSLLLAVLVLNDLSASVQAKPMEFLNNMLADSMSMRGQVVGQAYGSSAAQQFGNPLEEALEGPNSAENPMLTHKVAYTNLQHLCSIITLTAVATSCCLIFLHVRIGMHKTGRLPMLHRSASMFIGMIWAVPFFAILGWFGIIAPELVSIWQFLEALLLVFTMKSAPDLLIEFAGGRLAIQRRLLSSAQQPEPVPLNIFAWSVLPASLRSRFSSRVPTIVDVDNLRWRVVAIVAILPVLNMVELFLNLEEDIWPWEYADRPKHVLVAMRRSVITARILSFSCVVVLMYTFHTLHVLLQSLSQEVQNDRSFKTKFIYCQIFLGGLRLAPRACALSLLFSGIYEQGSQPTAITHSFLTCVAALVCAVLGWWAFPTREHLQHEHALASSFTPTGKLQTSKPTLSQIKFCPFCGSNDLKLETEAILSDAASCPNCLARHIPLHFIVSHACAGPSKSDPTTLSSTGASSSMSPSEASSTL